MKYWQIQFVAYFQTGYNYHRYLRYILIAENNEEDAIKRADEYLKTVPSPNYRYTPEVNIVTELTEDQYEAQVKAKLPNEISL